MTADATWSHQEPYDYKIQFSDSGNFTTFINGFAGAFGSYLEGNPATYQKTWLMTDFAIDSTAMSVTLTFLAQCPHDHQHLHHPTPDGTGRIIVITMNVPDTSQSTVNSTNVTTPQPTTEVDS